MTANFWLTVVASLGLSVAFGVAIGHLIAAGCCEEVDE
jgi:hypothetical protein